MKISFCDAIQKYILDPAHQNPEADPFDAIESFLAMLADGRLYATGYNMDMRLYENIPTDFWKWLRSRFRSESTSVDFKWTGGDSTNSVWKYENGKVSNIYEDIEVHDGDGNASITPKNSVSKNRGGRKPPPGWQIISAIACKAIHELGYDESQTVIVNYIEDNIDRLDLSSPPGRDNIIKLVRTIYRHRVE